MKVKSIIIGFVLCSLLSTTVFAHGKKDIEEKPVEDLNSWQETFDLEGKKKGKFNVFVTAKDLGGNTAVEGPFNLYVDPDSDLCIPGITNPYPGMRVVGNLNIVGTCVDDDGVDYVELVFDGNDGIPIRAEGAEFWSYYLDTTDMEEGPHTIKVTGYDINGLQGKSTSLTWQLDRRQPVTAVKEKDLTTDKAMGELVSGTVHFIGIVEDGNGIKELQYSIDNGEHFTPLKIKVNDKLKNAEFDVTVNTKNFPDGPAVIWFKATDNAGSVGVYSYLYFIDNTKPDVQIISPTKEDVVNGKFSIAGFAKDKIGISEITWTFGDESGSIDLIPGNPYWSLNFDTIIATIIDENGKAIKKGKDKSEKFTIKAIDIAGNVVEVTQTININQELDKPVVTITEPVPGSQLFAGDEFFIRGIAVDDDNMQFVKISLDGEEPVIQETKGDFYLYFGNVEDYEVGKHKLTVTGVDVNGVEGNPVTVDFMMLGKAPQFNGPRMTSGKHNPVKFVNGMEIHPEGGESFNIDITSETGIKNVRTEYLCQDFEPIETTVDLKNLMSYTATIPVTQARPSGVVIIKVIATDIYNRESVFTGMMYVTNTTVIKQSTPAVVFDDSVVDSEGRIVNNSEFPATGYLIGDKAVKVELVPPTPFAIARLDGNQITLVPGDAVGTSEKVVVRVTTAKGDTFDSIPLTFVNDTEIPSLKIDNHYETAAIDINNQNIEIRGQATCRTGMNKVKYRVMSARVELAKGIISKIDPVSIYSDFETVKLEANGSFAIDINSLYLDEGFYVVEVVAESLAGNIASKAVAYTKIPELEADDKGKIPTPKAPSIVWFDGIDVYAAGIYQGELDENFAAFARNDMNEGSNALSWNVRTADGKSTAGKYTASKDPTLSAHFALVNGETYKSGMPVVLAYGNDKNVTPATLTAYIDTGSVVNSASYEIYGDDVHGGDVKQTGTVKLVKPAAGETRWTAEIPLKNLPSRVTKIKLNIKAGSLETVVEGTVFIVRSDEEAKIDDVEKVYTVPSDDAFYNENTKQYVMTTDSKFYYYANLPSPISAQLVSRIDGLSITTEDKLITLTASKDNTYDNVKIRVTDVLGDVYESEEFNFLVDSSVPELNILTPELHEWQGDILNLSGTVVDSIGVSKVDYSLDGGEIWNNLPFQAGDGDSMGKGVTFSSNIDLKNYEDGLIKIDVRATDYVGNVSIKRTSVFKDTTPPEVNVVLPLDSDIVNGETLIVFDVKDNGFFAKANYFAPPKGRNPSEASADITLNPLIATIVGTEQCPIDDIMSFEFADDAGNKTRLEAWKFLIDNESDLPVSEIHLPEDNQVITRDFTISGVIYDDDGDADIYYKIDDGEYRHYPEMGTSFSVDVPLSVMTDNEHTITVYAVDVNGVKGAETVRKFRVSLEEPKGAVVEPKIDISVRERITISGWASDKNGIGKVQVSLDNGNSYNDAIITMSEGENAEWSYTVDTRAIPGGTQVVFLKVTDNYEIQGLYSSLINIDNENPVLSLDLPKDDSTTTGLLFFSGYSYDNVEITEMYVTIRNMETTDTPVVTKFPIERVIGKTIEITNLKDGFYNVELTAKDKAGNVTNVSRNIHLDKKLPPATVDLLYPLNGEHKTGEFNIYGQAESERNILSLRLYIDDKFVSETELTSSGFFKFPLTQDLIADGVHTYYVESLLDNGTTISSLPQTITYSAYGPWITIDSFVYGAKSDDFTYGDFATNRPYLTGRAGYSLSDDEVLYAKTKEAPPEVKAAVEAKVVEKIELSFDNGKTFIPLSKGDKWRYRIENQDIAEGYHFLLVRATMKNGETAIERTIIQIDNTKPTIQLIAPVAGGRYNQELLFSGLSGDDVELESVTLTLRKGDKSSYEVPSFFQGMYIDANFWGATLFDLGLGFTAFDDVVKIQLHWGQFTQAQRNAVSTVLKRDMTFMRYGGDVFGLKILANVASIPFSYFFGHDWEWLFAAFAVGANFSYFTETNSGKPQILSALIGQMEFPRVHFNGIKMFSTISMYTEGSIWFIPSDISSEVVKINTIIPQFSVGLRVNIF